MFRRARWRLVLAYTAILSIILVGLSLAVFTVFQSGLYTDVDASLRYYGIPYARYLGQHTAVFPGSCYISPVPLQSEASEAVGYTVVDCKGNTVDLNMPYVRGISPSAMNQALNGHSSLRTINVGSHYWRVYSMPIVFGGSYKPVGAVQLYRLVDEQVLSLHRLEQVLVGGGLAALLVAGAAGLFLSERTLQPIRIAFDHQRRFIADASHELRTPLTLIRGSAEMVATSSNRLEPEDAELLGDIVSEVDRLSAMVTDLLTLARVDNSQVELKRDPVDLSQIVHQTHEDVDPLIRQKNLSHVLVKNGPCIVIGDELRLRQLLLIILDNAIKYSNPGGTVETAINGQNGRVSVSVTDYGVGIPPEAMPHIFERFYRADGARTHETGGAGLGLSIAHWIVHAHGGKIHVSSRPSSGTRVTIDLASAGTIETSNIDAGRNQHVDSLDSDRSARS